MNALRLSFRLADLLIDNDFDLLRLATRVADPLLLLLRDFEMLFARDAERLMDRLLETLILSAKLALLDRD